MPASQMERDGTIMEDDLENRNWGDALRELYEGVAGGASASHQESSPLSEQSQTAETLSRTVIEVLPELEKTIAGSANTLIRNFISDRQPTI